MHVFLFFCLSFEKQSAPPFSVRLFVLVDSCSGCHIFKAVPRFRCFFKTLFFDCTMLTRVRGIYLPSILCEASGQPFGSLLYVRSDVLEFVASLYRIGVLIVRSFGGSISRPRFNLCRGDVVVCVTLVAMPTAVFLSRYAASLSAFLVAFLAVASDVCRYFPSSLAAWAW